MEPKPATPEQKQPDPPQQPPRQVGRPIDDVKFEQLIAQKLADANQAVLNLNAMVVDLQQKLEASNNVGAHLMEQVKRLTADNEALRKAMGDKAPAPPADPAALNAATKRVGEGSPAQDKRGRHADGAATSFPQ